MKDKKSAAFKMQWILLGLLMLVPGLLKLFSAFGPNANGIPGVVGLLGGIALFSWAPAFWAWVLVAAEIVFGVLILAKYKLKYTTIPPMIILAVATLFVSIDWANLGGTAWPSVLFHLIAITGYWMLMEKAK